MCATIRPLMLTVAFNWLAFGSLIGLSGCGPAKELPDETPVSAAEDRPPGTDEPIPTESSPEARAVVTRAIRAIAGGEAERLKRLRVSVSSFKGSIVLPNSPLPTPASLRWEIAWPDRARATYDLTAAIRQTFLLRDKLGWRIEGPSAGEGRVADGSPIEIGRIIMTELAAQPGVFLGLTLAEPDAVVFDRQKSPDESTTVKLKWRELPVLTITFDEMTGVPLKVEYQPREMGQRVHKTLILSEHKPVEGFLLPTKLEFLQNRRPGEQWTVEKWEFPESIDETRFDPPRP